MKNLIITLLFLLAFTSCQKENKETEIPKTTIIYIITDNQGNSYKTYNISKGWFSNEITFKDFKEINNKEKTTLTNYKLVKNSRTTSQEDVKYYRSEQYIEDINDNRRSFLTNILYVLLILSIILFIKKVF